jgi:hypothetical protein
MQYIFIVLAIVFYIVRFINKQKKEQAEAARRRQQIPSAPPVSPSTTTPSVIELPQPKTIDEILKEMHRRVETQNKPFAKPSPPQQKTKYKPVQKAPQKTGPVKSPAKQQEKKEPAPFLTEEYSAYAIAAQKVPENMAEDFIKQGELTDIYNVTEKRSSRKLRFDLRDAVVASIVLTRPEW